GLLAALVLAITGGFVAFSVKYLDEKERSEQLGKALDEVKTESGLKDEALGKVKEESGRGLKESGLKDQALEEAQYHLGISNVWRAEAGGDSKNSTGAEENIDPGFSGPPPFGIVWGSNNSTAALAGERLAAVPRELRKWEWHYLNRQYQGGLFTLYGH